MEQQPVIAAVATPVGTGAVGIVRMSGLEALQVARRVFVPRNGNRSLLYMPGYQGVLGSVVRDGVQVDEAVAFVYRGPKSYTGEDVVEICCHGGVFLVQETLRLCLENGARPAQAGEFTRRAFLNGKMDLAQAEGVCQLIGAHGESAARVSLSARNGAVSSRIRMLVQALTAQSAHLAAWADYPEEDLQEVSVESLSGVLKEALDSIASLLATSRQGSMLMDGIDTVIVGKPNVGKSTLMNMLAGTNRSIVTEIPGTTRDLVQDRVVLGDYVLHLWDTAGIRLTEDPVERQGVELARNKLESAQLVLAVFDSSDTLDQMDLELLELLKDKPALGIVNKVDLAQRLPLEDLGNYLNNTVFLSAKTGQGRDDLEQAVKELLGLDVVDMTAPLVATERQRYCLMEARRSLKEGLAALSTGLTLDAVNVCLDEALDELLSLTGERATEKVVDEVFARFCVGK